MQHPRGLQFILGTYAEPDMFDTIVMANLVCNNGFSPNVASNNKQI